MAEHLIRLRKAWEQHGAAGSRRVDLPTHWPPGLIAPLTLTRRFRRPTIDPARESITLRLEAVPGLVAIWLNGTGLDPEASETVLDGLLEATNVLRLEVDTGRAGGGPWGSIGLVIRPV